MQRAVASPTESPPTSAADWAAAFYARGWRDRLPWVVVEQVWPTSRRARHFFERPRGGWGFDLVSFRVLAAPMFDVFAPDATERSIIDAIRAYPTQRAALFDAVERPSYEAQGLAAPLIAQLAPRPDQPLDSRRLLSPILLVRSPPRASGYVLLGAASTLDAVLPSLIAHGEVTVDHAVALMLLFTCHGKPGDVGYETQEDGSTVFRRGDLDSAFLQPFHPRRFRQVNAALHVRTAEDSRGAREAELNRILAAQMRVVVESLRRDPPREGYTLHEAARSRLAERASAELGLSRNARTRVRAVPWYETLDDWPDRDRRAFLCSLTAQQRAELRAVRRGDRLPSRPSTPRVLLGRAKTKFDKMLRERRDDSA